MEGNEIEMSTVELKKWIREKVKKTNLTSSDVLEKFNLLQSLLKRKEEQAAHLLRLCQSVSACEAIVKKQYSLLGWEYRDTDSDDEHNITGCGNTVPSSPTTNGLTSSLAKLHDSDNLHGINGKQCYISLKREPVVVLTRLSTYKIRSFCSPTPENHNRENSDSDKQWEPEVGSSDADSFVSSKKTRPKKRRKIDQKNKKHAKSHATPQASTNTGAKSKVTKTSPPTPEASGNTDAKSNLMKTPTPPPPATTNGGSPMNIITPLYQTSDKATETPPGVPQVELKVNMSILARKRAMKWQLGKILEKVTKEDGRLKYKIGFEEKGKSLVSAHHMAFDYIPTVDQLFVGARVVVKFRAHQSQFCPGVLGELPSRENHLRFLVFIDDHKPVYVGLPLLRLVCRPLKDPLDDIADGFHKDFMKGYMKAWPYPPLSQYIVGQTINVEFNGVMQRCEVQKVDCSLMQVVVSTDQHKEWLYRGSTCLEHMIKIRELLELKNNEGQENKSPTVDESSKSTH
ncbi:histone-lysine N-methyltransferase SETDB1-B-like [Anoplopoma fimbria]|uniref:histone-lysine N-methyltransferase SETDB1-B-like n=1 Tax=Anoplopoma fimbria TaxID=229290 RepID=UPI0023EB629D|nr:histone-lysine N-methyltransferase SETDB1-B-like [Anoplopoma fimbria]XP_054462344.1 histone-lysine N-methyltransferase SETDB1-B-like [Anoplopoma fimbria]